MLVVRQSERFVRLLAVLRSLRARAKDLASIEGLIGGNAVSLCPLLLAFQSYGSTKALNTVTNTCIRELL